jgi:hypothetical protein
VTTKDIKRDACIEELTKAVADLTEENIDRDVCIGKLTRQLGIV